MKIHFCLVASSSIYFFLLFNFSFWFTFQRVQFCWTLTQFSLWGTWSYVYSCPCHEKINTHVKEKVKWKRDRKNQKQNRGKNIKKKKKEKDESAFRLSCVTALYYKNYVHSKNKTKKKKSRRCECMNKKTLYNQTRLLIILLPIHFFLSHFSFSFRIVGNIATRNINL